MKNWLANRSFQIWFLWSTPLTMIHFVILGIATSWQFPVVEKILWSHTRYGGEIWLTIPAWIKISRWWDLILCPLSLGCVLVLRKWFKRLPRSKQNGILTGCIAGLVFGFHSSLIAVFGFGLIVICIFGFFVGFIIGFNYEFAEPGIRLGTWFGVGLGAGLVFGPVAGIIAGSITLISIGLGIGSMSLLYWIWRLFRTIKNVSGQNDR